MSVVVTLIGIALSNGSLRSVDQTLDMHRVKPATEQNFDGAPRPGRGPSQAAGAGMTEPTWPPRPR
jgi:hypothetical protein